VQRTYSVMTNDVLISIPLFVFMGYVIERANVLDRLFRSLQLAAGPVPASLALATLATCAIFATATGIVGAVVTLMGLLAFPAMLRAGYDVKISAAVVCAGGCLGILIPPSVMLILYGATAGVSVVKLYAGAFFPGIMLAGLYMPQGTASRRTQGTAGRGAQGAARRQRSPRRLRRPRHRRRKPKPPSACRCRPGTGSCRRQRRQRGRPFTPSSPSSASKCSRCCWVPSSRWR
jgi:TRAP-type C4-dicarboxylate transport system permease large subunit